ncbi:MAG TPA: PP2C family protein-serine/threonine phosphatase [Planctomycetaceae bacterium]|nr:PP2C family protein-serine/threonine phosphatase [Planctomycetaceae bacterium]
MHTSEMAMQSYEMACLEVWGGMRAIETRLDVPGIQAWISSRPYQDAVEGGDLYFVSSCMGGHVARFVLADVSGHGASASQMAAKLRRLMRRHVSRLDQSHFARSLNHDFAAVAEAGRFATALLVSYNSPTDDLVVCNAGHPPPLWYRAERGEWSFLVGSEVGHGAHNLPLGIIEPTEYTQFAVRLGLGDMVLLYTDALPEAGVGQNQLLGEEGLRKLVMAQPMQPVEAFGRSVLAAIREHRGGAPADDDETLIALYHTAHNAPWVPTRRVAGALANLFGLRKQPAPAEAGV